MNPTKSILSDRVQSNGSARPSGKVRCGTKVLTRKAAQNPQAVAIYEQGKKQRRLASEIEKDIKALGIDNPMYPRNTRHFNVSTSDFVLPIFAEKVIEEYGEVLADEKAAGRQLYKFPVSFHSDHLLDFFPHRFESHAGADKFRSAFDAAGNRVCETLPEVKPEEIRRQRQEGVKRVPRRDWQVAGLCEPRVCKQFQSGQCTFRGQLKFYLPRISGLGLLALETSSEYAAENIWSTLDQVKEALGYIPRSNPNKPGQPVFFISKVQEERTYFNEEGKRVTGLQWVPRLTADIDMGTLLALTHAAPGGPTVPAAWLPSPHATSDRQVGAASEPPGTRQPDQPHPLLARILSDLESTGCNTALFCRYVAKKYGALWRSDATALQETFDAIQKLLKYGKDLDVIARGRLLSTDHDIEEVLFTAYTTAKFGQWTKSVQKMREVVAHIDELFKQGRDVALEVMQQTSQLTTHA